MQSAYATSVQYNFEVHMWVDVKQNLVDNGDPIATKSGLLQQDAVKCLLQLLVAVNQNVLGTYGQWSSYMIIQDQSTRPAGQAMVGPVFETIFKIHYFVVQLLPIF